MKAVKWCVGSLLFILGVIALILHKRVKSKTLGHVAVTALEAAHAPKIAAQTQKLSDLESAVASTSIEVEEAKHKVEQQKQKLQAVYSTVGLSTDEIVARLEKLKL